MNQLMWRLHRNQAYITIGALVLLATLLVVTGITMAGDYHRAQAACAATQSCGDLANRLFRGDGAIIDLVNFTLVIPLLFGLFWGAPLLAKEFEDGTHNLAWTQGVSRRHWLRVNLVWALVAAAIWGAALTALVSWWRSPENALYSRFAAFDVQGIVPVAYALFAVALGIAVGSLIRRVLPSLAVTLTVFVALRVGIGVYLRQHYMAPITSKVALFSNWSGPPGSWLLSNNVINGHGQSLWNGIDISQIPAVCRTEFPGGGGVKGRCLASHGFHDVLVYQPASRFWTFQGIEAGIFIVLAGVLVAYTVWQVRTRDA